MRSRSDSTPSDTPALLDDFEWPPRTDTVSVHEIDADPWTTNGVDGTEGAADVIFEADAPEPAPPPTSDPHHTS